MGKQSEDILISFSQVSTVFQFSQGRYFRVLVLGEFYMLVAKKKHVKNRYWQGESDCLIKTKQTDGRKISLLTVCDFCSVLRFC